MPVARISRGTRSRCRHYVRVPNKHPRHPVETTARAAEARDEGAFLGDLVKLRRFETRRQRKLDRLVLRIGDRGRFASASCASPVHAHVTEVWGHHERAAT